MRDLRQSVVSDKLSAKSVGNLNTDAALTVNGWHVETREDRTFVYDLDIAERAELANPHDIRKTIARAIEDGAIQVPAAAENLDSPAFLIEQELVPMPGGRGMKKATAYRLNRAAALFIVTRLRTSKAVELTLAIVKVFDQVTSGRALAPAAPVESPRLDALASAVADLVKAVGALVANRTEPSPEVTDFAGEAFARTIKVKVETYAGLMSNYTPSRFGEWRSRAHNQLRTRVRYPMGKGRSWARLPAGQRADAILALDEMLATAKQVYGDRAQPQLNLPTGTRN